MAIAKQDSKWIRGVDGATAMIDAARVVLQARLLPIVELLHLTSEKADEDPEYVHQLRVATRRADAAMRAFRSAFNADRWKKLHKTLREIRQAANDARMCDVHAMILVHRLEKATEPDVEALRCELQATAQHRQAAQKTLIEIAEHYPADKLVRRFDRLIESAAAPTAEALFTDIDDRNPTRLQGAPTLMDAAMANLPAALRDVRDAADADLSVYENLHNLRLKAKRLRYQMEIFAPCFDAAFRKKLYPQFKTMQDHLGRINDFHELAIRIEGDAAQAPDTMKPELLSLAEEYHAARQLQRQVFLAWFKEFREQGSLDELERFMDQARALQTM